MVTALVGGTLIDGNGGLARRDTTVVIDGDTIREVSQQREFGSDVRVVDLGGQTIMPGLIDCHAHFAHWGMNLISHQHKSLMLLAAETVAALRTTLEAGCTTARDLGGLDGGFREAVQQGLIAGPRLQCSLIVVSPTNGIVDPTTAQGLASPNVPGPASARLQRPVRGPREGARSAAGRRRCHQDRHDRRRQFAEGRSAPPAVHPGGGRGDRGRGPHGRRHGDLPRARRAGPADGRAGWRGLHRARRLAGPRRSWPRWRRAGPGTCRRSPSTAGTGPSGRPSSRSRAQGMREDHLKSFARARKAGVRIAMGTDIGGYGYGETALELELLVEAGMTPAEAIETSTRRSAECMRIDGEVGTLTAGKRADLLVVDGDPLADISMLRRRESLALVMQNGVAAAGSLRAALS